MWWQICSQACSTVLCVSLTVDLLCAEKVGAEVVECGCIIELPELKGREKLGKYELFVLAEKEGL